MSRTLTYGVVVALALLLAGLALLSGCSGAATLTPAADVVAQPPPVNGLDAGEDDGVVVPIDTEDGPVEYEGPGSEDIAFSAGHGHDHEPIISSLGVQRTDGTPIDVAAPGDFVRLVINYHVPAAQRIVRRYRVSPYGYSMANQSTIGQAGAHTAYRTFRIPSDATPTTATFSATVKGILATARAELDFEVDGPPKPIGPEIANVWVGPDRWVRFPPGPDDPPYEAKRGEVVRLWVRYYLEQPMSIMREYGISALDYVGGVATTRRCEGWRRTYKQLVIPPDTDAASGVLTVSMWNDAGVTSTLSSEPFGISSESVEPPTISDLQLRTISGDGRPHHTFKPGEKVGLLLQYDVPADMLVARDFDIPDLGYSRHRPPIWKYRGADRSSWVYYTIPEDFEQPSTHMEYGWEGAARPVGALPVSGTGTFAITVPSGH